MTPDEELRAAAARLRETAAKATAADWDGFVADTHAGQRAAVFGGPLDDAGYRTGIVFQLREDCELCDRPSSADVDWMVLMHPGLAEPLAAWLEEFAAWHDASHVSGLSGVVHECGADDCTCFDRALAVARVILGRSS